MASSEPIPLFIRIIIGIGCAVVAVLLMIGAAMLIDWLNPPEGEATDSYLWVQSPHGYEQRLVRELGCDAVVTRFPDGSQDFDFLPIHLQTYDCRVRTAEDSIPSFDRGDLHPLIYRP